MARRIKSDLYKIYLHNMSEVQLPIEYLDSWRIARDKIDNSFNKVVADVAWYRPHIENWYWWIWENNTGIKAEWEKVYFRATDEYIQYSKDNENWENLIAISELKWDKWDPWTDAWEYMTQAEYDDLPDSKLTDWISRAIYDTAQWTFRTLLREANNILHYNDDDELYADLQFENWLTPTSAFPAWVSIWNVVSTDWWDTWGLLLNAKTNNWEYMRWLYGTDGKLYFDGGTGVFKTIATTDDITSALSTLSNQLSTVAFSGKSSDLDNDAGFNSCPVMTQQQYDEQTGTASDDKRYFIYEEY